MNARRLAALIVLALTANPAAAAPPSFSKQVKPFFARYCVECHSGEDPDGGLNLESFKGLSEGGEKGAVFQAGKADTSRIVRMVEGKTKPSMPPMKKPQPKPAELAVLRAWIDAGAKDDSGTATVAVLPPVAPKHGAAPPVTALAYHPDGKTLAAGGYKEVAFVDPLKGDVTGRLTGLTAEISALGYSRDGKLLAVASGSTGTVGEVRLYSGTKLVHQINAHRDLIYDLSFSPDGKTLASCGYDRLIHLWSTETGKFIRDLKDHSDAVYAVAFSPDGKLLASGAADRAVKVWDVATGKRLYTLSESTDWVYALTWHPDGKHLAAGGVDKSIRVWEATATGGKVAHSVFAHEGAVIRLAYSTDGKSLYSLSEDRSAKAWDAVKMTERIVYPAQPEAPLAMSVRPDGKQVAIGRYDGVLVLLDEATGKTQFQPLPAKPKPPALNKLTPAAGTRGRTVVIRFEGKELAGATEILSTLPGLRWGIEAGKTADELEVSLTIPDGVPAGVYPLRVKSPGGETTGVPFIVDLFNPIAAGEGVSSPETAPVVGLPATLTGGLTRAGAVHFFRLNLKADEEVGVQAITAPLGSKLDPVLRLTDGAGRIVAQSGNGLLGCAAPATGSFFLSIHDRDYRPEQPLTYRLHVGRIPIATSVFPLGVQQGSATEVRVEGVFLGDNRLVKVQAPADAVPGSRLPVTLMTPDGAPLGNPSVLIGEFTDVVSTQKELPVPGTANGVLDKPGSADTWRFQAKKGQQLLVEINARRLGSPLDSTIEILDDKGQLLPRAVLRSVAKTYCTFRDHDSASPGIRLDTWTELTVNDYLLVGSELVRIRALPKNPDDDCQFFSAGGQRSGFLGTTPAHHPLGEPMYKVSIHPPGTTFPPNGLPVVTLYYRNDDGGAGFGKDSRLVFDAPADGWYQVRVRDAHGSGGRQHAYRLTIRPPRPNFTVNFNPTAPIVSKGSALPITVNAERLDEFDEAITLTLQNLPPGFSAPVTSIPAGESSTSFALFAEPGATVPPNAPPLKLTATAAIDGNQVSHEVSGGLPKAIDPGDIVTTTEQSAVTVKPGGETRLTVRIDRRNGFVGRIPLDVRGLPHGVRVLDIGLNGILITEKETTRTIAIYCEPWVQPTEHPFVVLAKREGKNSEHAAKSVLLKVAKE